MAVRSASSGQPLEFRGYPGIWGTDYGNKAYLRQWLQNVLTDVRSHGWNGVEVDNALNIANDYGVASKYHTDQSVQAATYAALGYLGPRLRLMGLATFSTSVTRPAFPACGSSGSARLEV